MSSGVVQIGDLVIDFENRKIICRGKELQAGGVTRPISPPITSEEIEDGAVITSKIADRAVTRAKLEYPTEDIEILWLYLIGKCKFMPAVWAKVDAGLYTIDAFTDKAVYHVMADHKDWVLLRGRDDGKDLVTCYIWESVSPRSTEDIRLLKWVDKTATQLSSIAVDIEDGEVADAWGQIVGSSLTLKYRGYSHDNWGSPLTATDTDIASGGFGIGFASRYGSGNWMGFTSYHAVLRAPESHGLRALAVLEAEVVGSGTPEDPYRPDLARQLDSHPRYGEIDKLAVTWSAFDHKHEHSTMLIMITGDNPYQAGAIDKQKEHASKKGLKVLSPPRDYLEAVEQYRKLKSDYPNWLAGKDNYAYQALGHEALELFQVADFYYGELLEHKTHYQQLKQVPSWEVERALNRWRDRLQRVDVLHEERNRHVEKLTEVLKKGW